MAQIEFRNVQPEEAIRFFEAKLPRESFDWREVWQEEHARNFTVAKSAGRDILGDIFGAVQSAIKDGATFEDFRKRLTPVLQDKGWWGRTQEIDPQTGQLVNVQLGSVRRLRTIYDTNISMAFAAGRWERLQRTKEGRPWLMYDHLEGQEHPRLHHAAWDSVTLHIDDPTWQWLMPPNGWGCHCSVISLSQAQYERQKAAGKIKTTPPDMDMRDYTNKRTGQTIKVPAGVDPGFAYNVGVAHMRENTPTPLDGVPAVAAESLTRKLYPTAGRPPMPAPRRASQEDLMPRGLPPADYVASFMQEITDDLVRKGQDPFAPGASTIKDPIGLTMPITDRFFITDDGRSKIDDARAPYVKLLARTLLDPDEIWLSFEPVAGGGYQLRRRYVARWVIPRSSGHTVVVIEEGKDGWRGVTAFAPPRDSYLDNQVRLGWLAYSRPDGGL